jgi:hypothetical protein
MTSIATLGPALYGPRWQVELARALGVSGRHMRRWAASGAIPDAYWPQVRALIDERIKLLKSLR